ncbi:PIG-L deacetylase family protein [Streptomyces venezuelae]|uniref:PIG-L deacetylase family protein n=1 Tax=Streptomyces venezuelae TaxID=54571 RepID=UPI00342051B6
MRTLVIAAHPDDEVLGPGATLAALARTPGHHVTVFIMSEGVTLRHADVTLSDARAYCSQAAAELGVHDLRFGGFGTEGRLLGEGPQAPVVRAVTQAVEDVAPDTVLTHHPGDIHIDHRVIAASVTYAARVMGLGPLREVLFFETLSSTEQQLASSLQFVPNVYYDVSGLIETKCAALACYPLELFAAPHPRSLEGVRNLAAMRGGEVGVGHAEAFSCGRQLRAVARREDAGSAVEYQDPLRAQG